MAVIGYDEIQNATTTSSDLVVRGVINTPGCIPYGLSADIMRKSIETKHLLGRKGSLYCGTGIYDSDSGTWITTALQRTDILNQVLTSNSSHSNQIGFALISPDYFPSYDSSVVYNIITSSAYSTSTDRVSQVPNAEIGVYPFNDTGKGTIDKRLTDLGF